MNKQNVARELLHLAKTILSTSAEQEVERLFRVLLPGTAFSGKAFAVGGYTRDQLLGLESKDLDVVVEGKDGAQKLTRWIHDRFPKETTNPHQLGAGYPIWQITFVEDIEFKGDKFQTTGAIIEFADSQKEAFPDPESRQRVTTPGTIEDDVQRRDFTVNMLLRDLSSGELKDLTGTSISDINKGVLRGHPSVDFDKILRDDPLRSLRLIRFQVKYGWSIPLSVLKSVSRNAERIQIISSERIRDELIKIMKIGKLAQAIRLMKAVGLLQYILPEVNGMRGIKQSPEFHSEGDVFAHTLQVLKNAPATVDGQLAALLHDVGKPKTQQVMEDSIHFYGHEEVGAEIAEAILYRLKFESDTIKKVTTMVRNHMRPHSLADASEKALRKFIRDLGEEMSSAVLELSHADEEGSHGEKSTKGEIRRLQERIEKIKSAPVQVSKKPIVNGFDIMQLLHIKPSEKVKEVMQFVLDLQDEWAIDGKTLTKEEAVPLILKTFGTK